MSSLAGMPYFSLMILNCWLVSAKAPPSSPMSMRVLFDVVLSTIISLLITIGPKKDLSATAGYTISQAGSILFSPPSAFSVYVAVFVVPSTVYGIVIVAL